tara:strand:+ start:2064 stop:3026 length:963 start_codon:yes stop_codon:yes gene_type:complete
MYFDDYTYSFQTTLIGFPIHMILCYLTIFVLMPRFLYRRKYLTFVLLLLASIFSMVLIKYNLTYFLVSENVWPDGPKVTNTLTLNYIIATMIGELYVVTFVTAIKITMDWIKEHRRVTDLEKIQLETELLFLRSQISPHFFFNTLNNIYSLAIEKSDKTSKIVLKLSELMRYLLYETKNNRQSLEKEIICIQNYLDLERIRHEELLEINMNISGIIKNKKIAPIILLSFVENAFKHGVNKNIGKVKINIDFSVKGKFLYFTIDNPIPKATKHKQQIISSRGIGLVNVNKRLALGYKPSEYDLQINSNEELYTVALKIKIK